MSNENPQDEQKIENAKQAANVLIEKVSKQGKTLSKKEKPIVHEVLTNFFKEDGIAHLKEVIEKNEENNRKHRQPPLSNEDKKAIVRGHFFEMSAIHLLSESGEIDDSDFGNLMLGVMRNPVGFLHGIRNHLEDKQSLTPREKIKLRRIREAITVVPSSPRNNDALAVIHKADPETGKKYAIIAGAYEMKNYNYENADSAQEISDQLDDSKEDMYKIINMVREFYPLFREMHDLNEFPNAIYMLKNPDKFKQVVVQPSGVVSEDKRKLYEKKVGEREFKYLELQSKTLSKLYDAVTHRVLAR